MLVSLVVILMKRELIRTPESRLEIRYVSVEIKYYCDLGLYKTNVI